MLVTPKSTNVLFRDRKSEIGLKSTRLMVLAKNGRKKKGPKFSWTNAEAS